MPTPENETLLDRNISKAEPVSELINSVSPLLQEAINYSLGLYQRCKNTKECSSDEAIAPLALFLHIIQMADSIDVLLCNGCAEPASLQLRSLFEARLGLEYMLQKNTQQRANSWIVMKMINDIECFETMDPSSPKGNKIIDELEKRGIMTQFEGMKSQKVVDYITKIRTALSKPEYSEVYAEYNRIVKQGRKYPEWYSFFDGPKTLKELSIVLGQDFTYQTLYSSWSEISHASSTRHLTFPFEDGSSFFGLIRNPTNTIHIGTMAISMILETIAFLVNKYRSYESTKLSKWYEKEVSARHMNLMQLGYTHFKWFEDNFINKK